MADWREVAYDGMTFNAPLSEERAASLVDRLRTDGDVVDLGCGWAELLIRVVAASDSAHGTGVDTDAKLLDRGRVRAARLGVADRVRFVEADARMWRGTADVAVCVGSSHAFGGVDGMLAGLREVVRPGGVAVVGEGVWASAPSERAVEILGALPSPDDVVTAVERSDFKLVDRDASTQEEWDAFEASFRSMLETSGDPGHRAFAATRREEYEEGYRANVGFEWLVLRG